MATGRSDHEGSIGLLVETGLHVRSAYYFSGARDDGLHLPIDVGATLAIGHEGDELVLLARGLIPSPDFAPTVLFGYRTYYGYDRLKTFLDLQVATQVAPSFAIGPRVAGGFQYELSPVLGVAAGLAGQVGWGRAFLLGAELFVAVQARTYVFQ